MATAAEDDDSWLYASEEPTVDKREEIPNVEVKEISDEQNNNENVESEEEQEDESTQAQKEVGELSGEDQETSNAVEDSDSDDDDDVQVTIKDINATANFSTFGSAPVNVNLAKRPPYSQTTGTVQSNNITTINKTKGLDIDAIGSINGVPSYDFNLDTLEDKPWMKPGADITDYFNYGFNEDTWKSYCERQKRLRAEIITAPGLTASKDAQNGLPSVNENSKYSGPTNVPTVIAAATAAAVAKKAGPPPGRKTCGAIDVIGGGTSSSLASRRVSTSPPKENPIQVMTGGQTGGIPPGITSIPPPGYLGLPQAINMPPPGMMPPGGPPGVSMTMPPMNLSMPPPNFQDPYYNRYPPPGAGNNANHTPNRKSEYDERKGEENYRGRSYDHEGERESWRDYDRKDSPPRSRDGERHRDSGRDRDRGRSRSPDDRRHRDYRDRESDRRDRDRDRRHRDRDRDREDRHRSKRKHYRDDEDDYDRDRDESSDRHRSSRHKRKRSRKDKEDEESDTRDGGETTSATGDDTQAD